MNKKIMISIIVAAMCSLTIGSTASNAPRIGKEYRPAGTKGGPMVYVPEGDFQMGCNWDNDNDCTGPDLPMHSVYLDAYYIDKFEVTAGDYTQCVKARKCKKPRTGEYADDYGTYGRKDRQNQPMTLVDWEMADAFCKWAGKRLPTEAEWEKAARGTDGRKYPWGNEDPDCTLAAVHMEYRKEGCPSKTALPVGSKPKGASPYGAMDMAGNVEEWVADWYGEYYYRQNLGVRNPQGPTRGREKVIRGGSWFDSQPEVGVRVSLRWHEYSYNDSGNLGFRCAKTP